MGASHYLNKWWNIVNWTLRNKVQWNRKQNSCIFIQENALENVVWKMAAILSRPQCVKRYCALCSKTSDIFHSCHDFPAGSREAAKDARVCETSLLSIIVYHTHQHSPQGMITESLGSLTTNGLSQHGYTFNSCDRAFYFLYSLPWLSR